MTMTKYLLFVSDSRGRGGTDLLQDPSLEVTTIIRPGAGLQILTNEAVKFLGLRKYDLVIIAGGICDLTKKEVQCGEKVLSYPLSQEDRSAKIALLSDSITKARSKIGRKLLLTTIVPASLVNYYYHHNPQKTTAPQDLNEQQIALFQDIDEINACIAANNRAAERRTPNWANFALQHSKKRKRKGSSQLAKSCSNLALKHLPDGVHFSGELLNKCVTALIKVAQAELLNEDSENLSRSDEEAHWDFKRAKPSTSSQ